jgi:hypothetical protein
MPRTKTISDKQFAANRRSAKMFTGTKSDAGRGTVSLNAVNAVKHDLTGHVAVLRDEDRDAHQTFWSELIDEMARATAMELNLAQSIFKDLTEDDPDPDHDPAMQLALASARTFMNHANKFGLLTIYEQRINRSVRQNRAELRLMQTESRQARQKPPAASVPGPISINALRTRTSTNGFVYANDVSALPPGGWTLEKAA